MRYVVHVTVDTGEGNWSVAAAAYFMSQYGEDTEQWPVFPIDEEDDAVAAVTVDAVEAAFEDHARELVGWAVFDAQATLVITRPEPEP